MKTKSLIFGLVLFSMIFYLSSAEVYPVTVQDFLVNPGGLEDIPHAGGDMAFDSAGNFIIVYQDRGLDNDYRQIYFQRFDSLANRVGEPVLVSDTRILHNNASAIAVHPWGSFVIAWGSSCAPDTNCDVWVRMYDSSGNPLGLWQKVDVDRPDPCGVGQAYHPDVAMDGEGNFVVVWQDQETGLGQSAWGQLFNSSGERVGNNFFVSDPNACDYQISRMGALPRVAYNSRGYFFVGWMGLAYVPGPNQFHSMGRVYRASGEPVTKVFPLFPPYPGSQWYYGSYVDLAANSQDNFVCSFGINDTLFTYPNNAVAVRTFDTLGNALNEIQIVSDVIDLGDIFWVTRIAVDDSDGYVVLWSDSRDGRNLWGQRFNSEDRPVGGNYRINIPPNSLATASGAGWNTDRFFLDIYKNTVGFAWADYRNHPAYRTDVYAKLLDLDVIGYYLPGDVVLDGVVNVADVVYLVNYLFKSGWGLLPEWTGDVDADGEVGLADVVYLINYLFKSGPPPQKPA